MADIMFLIRRFIFYYKAKFIFMCSKSFVKKYTLACLPKPMVPTMMCNRTCMDYSRNLHVISANNYVDSCLLFKIQIFLNYTPT